MIRLIIVLFQLLSLFSGQPEKKSQKQPVSADDLKQWVNYLASDEMRGRRNGSPEMKTAASWISEKFRTDGLKPLPGTDGYIMEYKFTAGQREISERNVIGFIEGTDPALKNEYIILTAHFDHIGLKRGNPADSICNGADDNAAGTATILGIAKAIKDSGINPGRNIIFAAVSGEESGMRGSRYLAAHSPVPLKNIYANLNFEMTGHSEFLGKRKYYMTGCKNSSLDDLIAVFNKNSGFSLVDTIPIAEMLFNSSDNIAFSRLSVKDGVTTGIPSGTFATTAITEYLHSVNDEAALFDFQNMADLVNHFSKVVLWLSENKTPVEWTVPGFVRP